MVERFRRLIENVATFVQDCANGIEEDEVIEQLQYNTWQTCNAILEGIEADRKSRGVHVPDRNKPRVNTREDTVDILKQLYQEGIVERKRRDQLTYQEAQWAIASPEESKDRPRLLFYRLAQGNRPKKAKSRTKMLMPLSEYHRAAVWYA